MMFQIKICGITTVDDALLAAEAGADAIGLNFYAKSPRCVTAERAQEIVAAVRSSYAADKVAMYAVCVNAAPDEIRQFLDPAGRGIIPGWGIQLHGDEPPAAIREVRHLVNTPVVRAFRCRDSNLADVASYLAECRNLDAMPAAILLDAFAPGSYGGTGHVVDWPAVGSRGEQLFGLPLVLAGGLTPENVAAAIATARPDAVDVASGVESSPGKKDPDKVRAFLAAAKGAFAKLQHGN
jgi:phosphoribosylanthranilate isomerase